jgi:hypothetical protein
VIAGVLALGGWGSPALAKVPSYLRALEGWWAPDCNNVNTSNDSLLHLGRDSNENFLICVSWGDHCLTIEWSEFIKQNNLDTIKISGHYFGDSESIISYIHVFNKNKTISFSQNNKIRG